MSQLAEQAQEGVESLARVLRMRGGFEMVNHQVGPTQVRMLGRVRSQSMGSWLVVANHLLTISDGGPGWSVDISKQYFRRSGKMMYAWRLIFQSEQVTERLSSIAQTVVAAPRARAIVDEQALPGVRGDRNAPSAANRGKGAQSSLKAAVGPMAVAALQRG